MGNPENNIINNPYLNDITSDILGPTGSYWRKNKDYIIYSFGLRLYQYSTGKMFDCSIHKTTTILPKNSKKRDKITAKIRKEIRPASRAQQFQRLLIGFYGLFENLTPHRCNLSSKNANIQKYNTVNDHVIGVTSIGKFTTEEFKIKYLKVKNDKNWSEINYTDVTKSIEKMCYEWLPNHLWLWAQCRITKEEHKSSNLERGTNMEIIEKMKLSHYNKARIIVENYK